jgi:hypothetical protein
LTPGRSRERRIRKKKKATKEERMSKLKRTINTGSRDEAGIGSTFVDVGFAERARVTSGAGTRERMKTINTCRTILAGIGSAFVDVGLT